MKIQLIKYPLLIIIPLLIMSCGEDRFFREDCINGEGPIVTEELEVDSFIALSSVGSFNITIREGAEQRVTATGHQNILRFLNRSVSGGEYFIRLQSGCYNDFELSLEIVTPLLTDITHSGSGNIRIESLNTEDRFRLFATGSGRVIGSETIDAPEFVSLESTGSGDMDLAITTDSLFVRQTGSGNLRLAGTATTQLVNKTGSGNYLAFDLDSERCEIDNSGSGIAELDVEEELEATLLGSGSIFYRGDPQVVARILGSGTVSSVD